MYSFGDHGQWAIQVFRKLSTPEKQVSSDLILGYRLATFPWKLAHYVQCRSEDGAVVRALMWVEFVVVLATPVFSSPVVSPSSNKVDSLSLTQYIFFF